MVRYIPNTPGEREEMLRAVGVKAVGELFDTVPEGIRLKKDLELPAPLSEPELEAYMRDLAGRNASLKDYTCFLGAGMYDHYIPSAVRHMTSRSEFYTAYTPYQPEISQGMLQAIFEYQTMICELTGMEVSNASMYDGATALAEAALMAAQSTGRRRVLVSAGVHPEYREVLDTYSRFRGMEIGRIGHKNGQTNLEELESELDGETAAVIIQNPSFFGTVEDITGASALAHKNGALSIVSPDPISLGLLKPPGEAGADIAAGEGQALGGGISFGGPSFGFLAAKKDLLRRMPGRIVGETADKNGKRGFVLTIQSREQHIRREKATSNICSNQALNALAATVYLTLMGKKGLREAAELCRKKAAYAFDRLTAGGVFKPVFNAPFFKEFALESPVPVEELNKRLLQEKIIGGHDLGKEYPELKNAWLIAVTEKRTRAEIDRFADIAGRCARHEGGAKG